MKTQEKEYFSINETLCVILTLSLDVFVYYTSPEVFFIFKNKLCKVF